MKDGTFSIGEKVISTRAKLARVLIDEKVQPSIVLATISMMYIGLMRQPDVTKEEYMEYCEKGWDNYGLLADS